jgi:putative ABC transport system permease protein
LLLLLSRESIKWVIIASVIALPAGWVAMRHYLQIYAYRITIDISFFLLSAALAIIIAFMTVSYQVVKTAISNPVEALRYE